jgi:hypothetical protein
VVQAVKLISRTFDGNPKHLREFCEGVETARQVVHPAKHPLLLKFIESNISGKAKDRLLARTERNTWEQIRAILEENYTVKRTLEYYAGILFTTKQGTNETVAQWGSRIARRRLLCSGGIFFLVSSRSVSYWQRGRVLFGQFFVCFLLVTTTMGWYFLWGPFRGYISLLACWWYFLWGPFRGGIY